MFHKERFRKLVEKALGDRSKTRYAEESEVNRTYISKIINDKLDSPPSPDILRRLADSSQERVSYKELMSAAGYLEGIDCAEKPSTTRNVAEIPIVENLKGDFSDPENIKGYKLVDMKELEPGDYFLFEMKDKSMINCGIKKGSLVLIKKQATVKHEDIAALNYKSKELLRKVYFADEKVVLQPESPDFKTKIVSNEDVEIIGKAINATFEL